MLVLAYGTELEDELQNTFITKKPKQNNDNLRKAREYLQQIVLEEEIKIFKFLGLDWRFAKGVLNGPWDPFWQEAKQATKSNFGYRLIRDIPWEQVPEVNKWCIDWIDENASRVKNLPYYRKEDQGV